MLFKGFANVPADPATAIACAGSTVADGTAIPESATFQEVTGSDGTKGVVLPSNPDKGHTVIVYSSAATNALKIYAASGGSINNGSANAAFSATARKPVLLKCLDNTAGANAWVALLGG